MSDDWQLSTYVESLTGKILANTVNKYIHQHEIKNIPLTQKHPFFCEYMPGYLM